MEDISPTLFSGFHFLLCSAICHGIFSVKDLCRTCFICFPLVSDSILTLVMIQIIIAARKCGRCCLLKPRTMSLSLLLLLVPPPQ
uniref:Uncharacterized protein n=1 Tax=Rhizophora mucronata TaxID=61149 RepID=A0A2P2IHK7_RHIMU